MKKIFMIAVVLCSMLLINLSANAEATYQPSKVEQKLDDFSIIIEETAEDASENIKNSSKKAGKFIKDKSIEAG